MNAPAVIGKQNALALPGSITATSLLLPAKLSFEEWEAAGQVLRQVERSCMWWIGDWWAFGDHKYGERAAQATEGAAFQTMADAGWVSRAFKPSDRSEVLSWTHHRVAASLPERGRREAIKAAEAGDWSVAELRSHIHRLRHADKRVLPMPKGVYSVIYADPPWQYENSGFTNAAESNYPTMPTDDICAMDIAALSNDQSILFLWATNPLLPDAMRVMEAWGFQYKTNLAWVKESAKGFAWFARSQHELLLIGVRENTPQPAYTPASVIAAGRPDKHSAKPIEAVELIERMYEGTKIELFQRSPRGNWDGWGNEPTLAA